MILKSVLKSSITEICEEHDIHNQDFIDDLVDRLQGTVDVMDDDDDEDEEEDGEDGVRALRAVFGGDDE